jgi:protein-S-isoprenylcysteine O-methyltransferase Ste14
MRHADCVTDAYRLHERALAWALVGGQLSLLAALVFLPGDRMWPAPIWLIVTATVMVVLGGLVAVLGALRLGSGLTASPLPNAAARLRTDGVFACVRHPIYTGLLLGGAGVVLASGRITRLIAWLALLVLLAEKARFEERRLRLRFPGYQEYASRTPRLLPHPVRCLAALRRDRRRASAAP